MNVDACACLPITAAMSRLDLRIGVSLPGRCGVECSLVSTPEGHSQ
jgi:hypothetical protein